MMYEILFRYIAEGWLDKQFVHARNEMEAKIKFWDNVLKYPNSSNIKIERVEEYVAPDATDDNNNCYGW